MASAFAKDDVCEERGCDGVATARYYSQVRHRRCKNHVPTDQSALNNHNQPCLKNEEVWLCPDHDLEEVRFFCRTCECGVCVSCLEGRHMHHEQVTIQEVEDRVRRDLEEVQRKIRSEKLQLKKEREEVKACEEQVKASFGSVRSDIKETITQNLEQEMNNIHQEYAKKLAELNEEKKKKLRRVSNDAWNKVRKIDTCNDMQELRKNEKYREHQIQEMNRKLKRRAFNLDDAEERVQALLASCPKNVVEKGQLCSHSVIDVLNARRCDISKTCDDVLEKLPQLPVRKRKFIHKYGESILIMLMNFPLRLLMLYESYMMWKSESCPHEARLCDVVEIRDSKIPYYIVMLVTALIEAALFGLQKFISRKLCLLVTTIRFNNIITIWYQRFFCKLVVFGCKLLIALVFGFIIFLVVSFMTILACLWVGIMYYDSLSPVLMITLYSIQCSWYGIMCIRLFYSNYISKCVKII